MNFTALEALAEVAKEMQVTASADSVAELLSLAEALRGESLVSQLNADVLRDEIWGIIRGNKRTVTDLFSLTNTFMYLQGDNVESDIRRLADALVIFPTVHDNTLGTIADRDLVEGATNAEEYFKILNTDRWLYFLVSLSMNLRSFVGKLEL